MPTADPFQTNVARLALDAAREHGFALAGGHALIAHGIVSRSTEDVDLFTNADGAVQAAAQLVERKLLDAGFNVEAIPETSELGDVFYGFERDIVEFEISKDARTVRLQLCRFDRSHSPVVMEVPKQLIELGSRADPALTDEEFADAMRRFDRLDDEVFETLYGRTAEECAEMRKRFAGWPRT